LGGGEPGLPLQSFLRRCTESDNKHKYDKSQLYILFYKLKGDCEVYFITSNPLFNIFQSIILHPDSSCTLELRGLVGGGGRRLTIDVFKEKGK